MCICGYCPSLSPTMWLCVTLYILTVCMNCPVSHCGPLLNYLMCTWDVIFTSPREWLQSIVMSMSVCLPARISLEPRASFTKCFCMLSMFLARFSSGMLMIGRSACRRELGKGDGNAQLGRSVIYDCLVKPAIKHKNMNTTHFSGLKVWLKLTLKLF